METLWSYKDGDIFEVTKSKPEISPAFPYGDLSALHCCGIAFDDAMITDCDVGQSVSCYNHPFKRCHGTAFVMIADPNIGSKFIVGKRCDVEVELI